MTKLPKIEKCVCGQEGVLGMIDVHCKNSLCWTGPSCDTQRHRILAWNAVMKAAKAAKKARAK